MAKDYSWVTDEMFRDKLEQLVNEMDTSELLSVPGVYEALSEYLNNDVLKELEEDEDDD